MLHCIGILFLSFAIISVTSFNNTCLLSDTNLTPPTPNAPQTFLKDCPAWVIESTDAAWNTRQNVNASLEKYFYENWSSTTSWGQRIHGMDKLKSLVARTLRAFPDYRIHITDVFCYGNDIDGYKTVMPDILTGTNTGPSSYGPATGKKFRFSGTAVTYVQKVKGRWVYVAEWLLHDEFSLISQLGFTNISAIPHPPLGNKLHDCSVNEPGFGWRAPGETDPMVLKSSNLEIGISSIWLKGCIIGGLVVTILIFFIVGILWTAKMFQTIHRCEYCKILEDNDDMEKF